MSVAEAPLVSVVVVTYGTGPVVVECLGALAAHTSVSHEVIVVDSPPDDGRERTAVLLARRAGITLVEIDENLGFAGGNEVGVQHARGEFLCFLNPDVIVGPNWLEPLLGALDDPVVAIAAPVLRNRDGSLQEAGQLLYDDACTAAVGGPEIATGDEAQVFTRDVDYSSAACWVVRRTEHLARGGFDRRFHPVYFEDVDYALRVEAEGKRTRLVAASQVVHLHGEGGAGRSLTLGEASRAVFAAKWPARIAAQPPRPQTALDAIENRDRLAAARRLLIAPSRASTAAARRAALDRATKVACRHPRDRVTFVTDDAAGLDVDAARRAGVEVVVGDVERIDRERAPRASERLEVRSRIRPPTVLQGLVSPWTVLVALAGVLLRVIVLRSASGELNSDEAYTGLQAMGILEGRLPIVVDGNRYTAVLESYLFAPVVAVAGPSIVLLKLIPMVFWAIAAVLAFAAASHLAGRRAGAVAGAMVWITPGALLVVSTLAYVGYALGMAVCVAALWAAARVIDRESAEPRSSAVLGGLAGLGFYVHPMFVAVLLPVVVPVAWHHRRAIRAFWVPFTVAGIVVNLPFLLWNAVNGWPSLEPQNSLPGTYTDRLSAFFRELVPRGYGLQDLSFDWVLGRGPGIAAYVLIGAVAVVGAVALVRTGTRRSRWLVPIALVAVWPIMALFSPLIWSIDGRYNVIAFPIVAIAVAAAVATVPLRGRAGGAVGVAAVVLWAAIYVWPHTNEVVGTERVDANAPLHELVDFLEARGVERVAGSYWRVLTAEYASDLRVVGAVSPPDAVRFPERQREVQASPPETVAFVFPVGAEDTTKLWMPPERYERVVVGNTVVYVPLPVA